MCPAAGGISGGNRLLRIPTSRAKEDGAIGRRLHTRRPPAGGSASPIERSDVLDASHLDLGVLDTAEVDLAVLDATDVQLVPLEVVVLDATDLDLAVLGPC